MTTEPAGGFRSGSFGSTRDAVRFLVVVGLIGALAIAAAWIWGVPMLAAWAAEKVPPEWERSFGAQALAGVAPPANRVDDPRVVAPAAQVLAVLVAAHPSRRDSFDLVVLRAPIVNAFALPGGFLVVTTGLLRTLDGPDELAAVLAHEMTHEEKRHSLRQMFARLGLRTLLAVVIGDHGGASGLLGGAAGTLGELSYSRKEEIEADDGALAHLARAGIDPRAMDRALGAIDSEAAHAGAPDLSFLSTHPGTRERRARIRRLLPDYAVTPSATLPDARAWGTMEEALVADSVGAARNAE